MTKSNMLTESANDILDITLFSTLELEILSSISHLPNKDTTTDERATLKLAHAQSRNIYKHLADVFEHGSDDAATDPWKVAKYRKKIGQDAEEPGSPYLRTDYFYKFHSWFYNGIRLLIGRVNRIFIFFYHSILPAFFGAFGLTLGLSFLIDLSIIIKKTFQDNELSEKLSEQYGFKNKCSLLIATLMTRDYWRKAWIRCKNTAQKDNRPYRMMNDSIWFSINLIVFILAGPAALIINPILNLGGFFFDLVHEFFWLGKHYQRHTGAINKLDDEMEAIKNDPKMSLEEKNRRTLVLAHFRKGVDNKRSEVVRRHSYIVLCASLILLGMGLALFPPTAIPFAFLIGSGLALFFGSAVMGFGRRIYLIIEEAWMEKKSKATMALTNALRLSPHSASINSTYLAAGTRYVFIHYMMSLGKSLYSIEKLSTKLPKFKSLKRKTRAQTTATTLESETVEAHQTPLAEFTKATTPTTPSMMSQISSGGITPELPPEAGSTSPKNDSTTQILNLMQQSHSLRKSAPNIELRRSTSLEQDDNHDPEDLTKTTTIAISSDSSTNDPADSTIGRISAPAATIFSPTIRVTKSHPSLPHLMITASDAPPLKQFPSTLPKPVTPSAAQNKK